MKDSAKDYNVLLIISDQHHRKVSGCYGNSTIQTPNIDSIAKQGVTFQNCYCQEPICGPSRASLMTGTYTHTCNAFSHKPKHIVPEEMPTLGTAFRNAGYTTGSIGKVHVAGENKEKRDLGFDERALRYYTYEYQDYIDMVGLENVDKYASHRPNSTTINRGKYNPTNEPVTLEDNLMYDNIVTDLSIKFMEKNRDNKFFLWMGLEKPHPQWYAPEKFHKMYNPDDMVLPDNLFHKHKDIPKRYEEWIKINGDKSTIGGYSKEELRTCLAAYYANISYMDMNVGRAISALERLGLREKTIIIYTSDHGEMLTEHALFQKHCLYEAAIGVPFVISCPGIIPSDISKKSMTSLIDVFPTLMDLTGIEHPKGLEGESLTNLLHESNEDENRVAFSEMYVNIDNGPAERMIRSGKWKYIYSHNAIGQLYDLEKDPWEMDNLAVNPKHKEMCEEFERRILEGWEVDEFNYDGEG